MRFSPPRQTWIDDLEGVKLTSNSGGPASAKKRQKKTRRPAPTYQRRIGIPTQRLCDRNLPVSCHVLSLCVARIANNSVNLQGRRRRNHMLQASPLKRYFAFLGLKLPDPNPKAHSRRSALILLGSISRSGDRFDHRAGSRGR